MCRVISVTCPCCGATSVGGSVPGNAEIAVWFIVEIVLACQKILGAYGWVIWRRGDGNRAGTTDCRLGRRPSVARTFNEAEPFLKYFPG